MAIAQVASFLPLLKKNYQDTVRLHVNVDNPLFAVIKTVKEMNFVGEQAVFPAWIGINPSAAPRAELQELPQPGRNSYANFLVDIQSNYATTKISRQAQFRAKSPGAMGQLVNMEMKGVTMSHKRSLGRQVWTRQHGGFAEIEAVAVDGGGQFTLTLTEKRPFIAGWFFNGFLMQTGTLNPTTLVMTARAGSYEVVGVNQNDRKIVIVQTPNTGGTPVVGDQIFVNGGANIGLTGVEDIVSDTPLHGRSTNEIPTWKATILDNGGVERPLTPDLLKIAGNMVGAQSNSGRPDYWLTSQGIGRHLYNTLAMDYNYTGSPSDLQIGQGVTLPGGGKLVEDHQAAKHKVFGLNKSTLGRMSVQDGGEWLTLAGDNALRPDRTDSNEFNWVEDLQIFCEDRSANVLIDDIEDDDDY